MSRRYITAKKLVFRYLHYGTWKTPVATLRYAKIRDRAKTNCSLARCYRAKTRSVPAWYIFSRLLSRVPLIPPFPPRQMFSRQRGPSARATNGARPLNRSAQFPYGPRAVTEESLGADLLRVAPILGHQAVYVSRMLPIRYNQKADGVNCGHWLSAACPYLCAADTITH